MNYVFQRVSEALGKKFKKLKWQQFRGSRASHSVSELVNTYNSRVSGNLVGGSLFRRG